MKVRIRERIEAARERSGSIPPSLLRHARRRPKSKKPKPRKQIPEISPEAKREAMLEARRDYGMRFRQAQKDRIQRQKEREDDYRFPIEMPSMWTVLRDLGYLGEPVLSARVWRERKTEAERMKRAA